MRQTSCEARTNRPMPKWGRPFGVSFSHTTSLLTVNPHARATRSASSCIEATRQRKSTASSAGSTPSEGRQRSISSTVITS